MNHTLKPKAIESNVDFLDNTALNYLCNYITYSTSGNIAIKHHYSNNDLLLISNFQSGYYDQFDQLDHIPFRGLRFTPIISANPTLPTISSADNWMKNIKTGSVEGTTSPRR